MDDLFDSFHSTDELLDSLHPTGLPPAEFKQQAPTQFDLSINALPSPGTPISSLNFGKRDNDENEDKVRVLIVFIKPIFVEQCKI